MNEFTEPRQLHVRCAVVGAGVVGLSVATQLQEQMVASAMTSEITVIADSIYDETTSYGCGGFWEPYQVGGTPEELIIRWGEYSYKYFLKLHFSEYAAAAGVQVIPAFYLYEEEEMPHEIPCWKDVVLNFQDLSHDALRKLAVPEKFVGGYTFTTVIADQSYYLKWMADELTERGVTFEKSRVSSLVELANSGLYDIIVNCTGLGASSLLFNENDLYPVRGQVFRVKAPWMKAFWNFGPNYLIPNVDTVVVGGTAQKGDYSTVISDEDSDAIMNNVCALFPALRSAPVERIWAGLRPCRSQGIRLESSLIRNTTPNPMLDYISHENESCHLVPDQIIMAHCYGHGGCGVTLGMGCADDLVRNHIMPHVRQLPPNLFR